MMRNIYKTNIFLKKRLEIHLKEKNNQWKMIMKCFKCFKSILIEIHHWRTTIMIDFNQVLRINQGQKKKRIPYRSLNKSMKNSRPKFKIQSLNIKSSKVLISLNNWLRNSSLIFLSSDFNIHFYFKL